MRWPVATQTPVNVQYESLTHVRASSPGFIRTILVQSGQTVQQGQPIVRLENDQLVAELQDLELAIRQSELKCRVFRQNDEIHSYQAEMEQLHSFQEKRTEKQQQVERLTLRAASSGRVIARNLSVKVGDYLQVGDDLAGIGNDVHKELQIAIRQEDYDQFKQHLGREIHVRISGGVVLMSRLHQVEPRATKRAPHESMYAALGGPLESRTKEADTTSEYYELLSAHLEWER